MIQLKKRRKELGFSQKDVAEGCEITQQYYSYIENGLRNPHPKTAQKIASVLDFDWTLFYEKTQKPSCKEAV